MNKDLQLSRAAAVNKLATYKTEINVTKNNIKQKLITLYENSPKICALVLNSKESGISIELITKYLLTYNELSQNDHYKPIANLINREDLFDDDVRKAEKEDDIKELIFTKLEYLTFILVCVDQTMGKASEKQKSNDNESDLDAFYQSEYLIILLDLVSQMRNRYYPNETSPFDVTAVKETGKQIVSESNLRIVPNNSKLARIVVKKGEIFSDPSFADDIFRGFYRAEYDKMKLDHEKPIRRNK